MFWIPDERTFHQISSWQGCRLILVDIQNRVFSSKHWSEFLKISISFISISNISWFDNSPTQYDKGGHLKKIMDNSSSFTCAVDGFFLRFSERSSEHSRFPRVHDFFIIQYCFPVSLAPSPFLYNYTGKGAGQGKHENYDKTVVQTTVAERPRSVLHLKNFHGSPEICLMGFINLWNRPSDIWA